MTIWVQPTDRAPTGTGEASDLDRGPSTALLTDHYELTALGAALRSGVAEHAATFEVFARRLPDGRRYGVVAGLARAVDAVARFRFGDSELQWLRDRGFLDDVTLDWLADYRFSGDIVGYHDGELFFPYSPVLTVEAPFGEGLVLETVLLSVLNHDCAIAGAASRMVEAAAGRSTIEGGGRRTHEEAAVVAALAAYTAGFDVTSNLEAGRRFGIPTAGTTMHAFTLAHRSEREAFEAQYEAFGADTTYLVDTYDIADGIRTAVDVAGPEIAAVRLDSGDAATEATRARALLDELGATGCQIVVSGDLDEHRIAELVEAEVPIDRFMVGTQVVTGSGAPTAELVYKLVAIADRPGTDVRQRPVAKTSEGKGHWGDRKVATRILDEDGFAIAERVVAASVPGGPVTEEHVERAVQVPWMIDGQVVRPYHPEAARAHHAAALSELRPEHRSVAPGEPVLDGRPDASRDRDRGPLRWAIGVVDVQNDFCEGGSLAVEGGAEVARRVRAWLDDEIGRWAVRFGTADRHPPTLSDHFAEPGTDPNYVDSWPAHCVAGTPGSELHPNLLGDEDETDLFDVLVEKGQHSAAYSGFEGTTPNGVPLAEWLRDHDIDGLELTGIATDHCVRATASDALDEGFAVRIVIDLCAGIDDAAVEAALADLEARGAEVVTSAELTGAPVGAP